MKERNTQAMLSAASAAVSVMDALEATNQTMSYKQLLIAVGLIETTTPWHVDHRYLVTEILELAQVAGAPLSLCGRIINAKEGEPGSGFARPARITRATAGN